MLRAYAVPEVRRVEEAAMARLAPGELMQRAAAGLAEVVSARLAERAGSRLVALVGGGNNGGDALYAAARLARDGATVHVVRAGAVHQAGLAAARAAGVGVLDAGPEDPGEWRAVLGRAEVVVDGITGIGGRPGLSDTARTWVAAIPDSAYVVAVDLPSGVDPAGERGSADCVFADETVTFGVAKPCHLLPAGEPACGRLTVVDIGLDVAGVDPAVERVTHDDVAGLWPVPGVTADKYSRGVVGIVAGSTRYPGAAVLSVLGALGAGVGMVRYLGPAGVAALVHQHAPEAVTADGRVQSWVLGSGVDPRAEGRDGQVDRIRAALASDRPCVVDAGALELVTAGRAAATVLTPHAGELATLLSRLDAPVTREQVTEQPLRHARAAAQALGVVVLLKGSTTLVVAPGGRSARAQADAPAWLATAGAGDVLGGLLGALLAGGLDPVDAASLAALVHGVAADRVNPGGPVRALGVAGGIPEAVAHLLRR